MSAKTANANNCNPVRTNNIAIKNMVDFNKPIPNKSFKMHR